MHPKEKENKQKKKSAKYFSRMEWRNCVNLVFIPHHTIYEFFKFLEPSIKFFYNYFIGSSTFLLKKQHSMMKKKKKGP